MKMIFQTLVVVLSLFTPSIHAQQSILNLSIVDQQVQDLSYTKWGKLAMQETKRKYPQAEIIDYLHIGRKALTPSSTQETFKLWLREDQHEFGVIVKIAFDTLTQKVNSISFEETTR